MKILKKTRKGFTLIELLLYMGLLSIFMFVLTDLLIATLDIRTESEANSAVEQDSRFILTRIMYDVARADAVTLPASLGESANSLVLSLGVGTVTYSLVGGDLIITDSSDSGQLNSTRTVITAVDFQKIGNVGGKDTVKISLTVESVAVKKSGRQVRTVNTTVGLR